MSAKFSTAVRAEIEAAWEDYRAAVSRQLLPTPTGWRPPSRLTRARWAVRRKWRWITGLRIAHKDRIKERW